MKSTDLRTIFCPHAIKPESDTDLGSLRVHFKERMRREDVESGNDRLGWQQGVCYASFKRTAAGVGLEPVKLQWDPTSLPTPSSLHLSGIRLLTATPPFPIFCLFVRVTVIQLI